MLIIMNILGDVARHVVDDHELELLLYQQQLCCIDLVLLAQWCHAINQCELMSCNQSASAVDCSCCSPIHKFGIEQWLLAVGCSSFFLYYTWTPAATIVACPTGANTPSHHLSSSHVCFFGCSSIVDADHSLPYQNLMNVPSP